MKNFNGKVLFLDRSDINTDEIIPAKYLTESTKEALKPYTLEDLKIEGFDPGKDLEDKSVIITRENFGCGSSREHAPWALEMNDINLVLAVNFARIFRQNMFNCGMMAIEMPKDTIDGLFSKYADKEVLLETDFAGKTFTITADGAKETISFELPGFAKALVEAGGWVNFADNKY